MEPVRYLADPADLMPSCEVEGFTVVHHVPSGATHLLAPPVPEILATIDPERGAASAAEIVERLRHAFELEGDAAAVVTARLDELEAAGLVRRA